jgi:radical SAM protein with 4Fe4S-binding SPASM domain
MLENYTKTIKLIKNIYIKKKNPISLIHFLTNRCNARCSFCFIDFDNPKTFKNELTLSEIKEFTKTLGDTLMNVNFTGGEPFARKDIIEIAKAYIDNSTIQSIYTTTNGSLPDRVINFCKDINKYNPNIELNIQISIDDLPEEHNKVRKIKNLFNSCIELYREIKKIQLKNVSASVSITVSHENCDNIKNIFFYLVENLKIDSIKCCIVRDEGVYKRPIDKTKKILDAYEWLTNNIKDYKKLKKINNYNNTFQGKVHNAKDEISWEMVKKIYSTNEFISNCHAGTLFGIIASNGDIFPCEILENSKLGNLRENNLNFMKIWENNIAKKIVKDIIDNKCRCTYECGMSFNILGNTKYHPKLLINSLFQ